MAGQRSVVLLVTFVLSGFALSTSAVLVTLTFLRAPYVAPDSAVYTLFGLGIASFVWVAVGAPGVKLDRPYAALRAGRTPAALRFGVLVTMAVGLLVSVSRMSAFDNGEPHYDAVNHRYTLNLHGTSEVVSRARFLHVQASAEQGYVGMAIAAFGLCFLVSAEALRTRRNPA